jgi:hypothetical protein
MTAHNARPTPDALDALVAQLLDCGGVLSQMIGSMQEFEASGLSLPDAPPILEIAHRLIRDVVADLPKDHSEAELRLSAEIVEQVATAICENIFIVPTSEIRRTLNAPGSAGPRRRRRGAARQRRR